jgi:hypothetical protein
VYLPLINCPTPWKRPCIHWPTGKHIFIFYRAYRQQPARSLLGKSSFLSGSQHLAKYAVKTGVQTVDKSVTHYYLRPCAPPAVCARSPFPSLTIFQNSPSPNIDLMLELQLPHPMPHAVPREQPFDFYSDSRSQHKVDYSQHKVDSARIMQLPQLPQLHVPRHPHSYEPDPLRRASSRRLTPPSEVPGSAVRLVSLPPNEGAGQPYGYQLPAIGNSRMRSGNPDTHQQQESQDVRPQKKVSISPNLRIPDSITTPQEGLAQLAAEVSAKKNLHGKRGLISHR